ncbi:MAG: single-stranded DNA-binding protein [Eubacteriales bacterium]|nr:single-stranded DNA-binding protein [Eubacteriales bacterium]MDD4134194.1 single-stranded DNA-binding protein [Eubacteriales bacterium]
MNKIFLIGNLTRDPELRSTQSGVPVCTFTVAVNRRRQSAEAGQPEADFFRVTTWRQLAENCNRYLAKGRKVGVSGTLTLQNYTGNDGQQRYSLEVQADEVEFLTPRSETGDAPARQTPAAGPDNDNGGFVRVDEDDLPF